MVNTSGDRRTEIPPEHDRAFGRDLADYAAMEQDGDVLREGIRVLSQALMESEVAGLIGAERHERSGDRTAYRDGARTQTWDNRVGDPEGAGWRLFSVPAAARPADRARAARDGPRGVVHGVSTRKVDDLVKALGLDGISKSEVRACVASSIRWSRRFARAR